MNENNSNNKSSEYILTSGAQPHIFTEEEQSKGGQATKFNALKHGKYATKLSESYVCPNCGNSIEGPEIMSQKELCVLLSDHLGIYQEMKTILIKLKELFQEEVDANNKFIMGLKYIELLNKLFDKKSYIKNRYESKKEFDFTNVNFSMEELENEL
jgi:hypothetical protein